MGAATVELRMEARLKIELPYGSFWGYIPPKIKVSIQ
jgi:hypothetical protein